MENSASTIAKWLESKKLSLPYAHVILGSGLAMPLNQLKMKGWNFCGELGFSEIPGINPSTAPGHKGTFRFYQSTKSKRVISFQTGRLHGYEGNTPAQVVKPVLAFADLGVDKFIITNATGSLQTKMKAGSVMMIEDQFNFTGQNPLTGHNDEKIGPRFPDMSQIYSTRMNRIIEKNIKAKKIKTHRGTYIGVNGPSFETPAETKLFSKWGMGAVGMSTVFEGIALKHRNKEIAGVSFLANMAAGIGDKAGKTLSGDEVLEEALKKAPSILMALFESMEQI